MSISRVILLVVGLNTLITVGSAVFGYLHLSRPAAVATATQDGGQPLQKISGYAFYPVEKIVINLPGDNREYYFVLDLALQADLKLHGEGLKQIEPLVRNSVISSLSMLKVNELRALAVSELQVRLDSDLRRDLSAKGWDVPFSGLLISKMLVQ